MSKTVHVAAAVICDDLEHPTKVFAAARGYGEQKGQWEFPGGKIEPGETPRQALMREIREELDITVQVGAHLHRIEYDYPAFHLTMDCFRCIILEGQPVLKEAEAARWLTRETLLTVQWLPADREVLTMVFGSERNI